MRRSERWLELVRERGLAAKGERCPTPIDLIEADHKLQLEFCDLLELIADCLPGVVNGALARAASSTLREGFPAHTQFEDDILFPLLRRRGTSRPWLCRALDQLMQEHSTDEDYGHEVADALDGLAAAGKAANPDMVGYMLRGFFLSQRRHVEWENAVVLPQARELLTENDLDQLCEYIVAGSRWQSIRLLPPDVRSFSRTIRR